MKKLLALCIGVCMLLSSFTCAFAYPDVEEGTYVSEAVTVLSGLDILNGFDTGNFKPEEPVTRAQMAKIICEILGYDNLSASSTVFTDVPSEHWASGYISAANSLGIINGYGDGTYGPEEQVTYNQAAKMIICALGYGVICDSYPSSYLNHANTLKLFANVKDGGEKAATRADIAVLVYNALDAAMLIQTSFGSEDRYEVVKDYTLLSKQLNVAKVKGVVNSVDFKEEEANITIVANDESFSDIESGTYTTATDLTDCKNLVCTIYIDTTDDAEPVIVAAVPNKKADIVTITDDKLFVSYDNNEIEYFEDINDNKTKSIDLVANIKAYVNDSSDSVLLTDFVESDTIKSSFDSIKFIDANNDGEFETAVIEVIEAFVVKSVNDRTMTIVVDKTAGYSFGKAKLVLDNDKITYDMNVDISDINIGDVINIKTSEMDNGTHYEIYVSNETIEGYVDAQDDDFFYINDEPYSVYNNVDVKLGTTGVFTLDMKGNIIAVDTTTTATSVKWGYVVATGVDADFTEDKYMAKIVDIEGDEDIYAFAKKVRVNDDYADDIEDIYVSNFEDLTGLVGYKLNSNDEITAIYNDFSKINRDYSVTSGVFKIRTDGRLGSYYTSDDALIFNVKDVDDITVQPSTGLIENTDGYTISTLVYNSATNEIVIAVGEDVVAAADPASAVMLVKSISLGLDDIKIVRGYVDGELVEFTYDPYELEMDIAKGDLIQYTLSGKEAIGVNVLGNVKTIGAASMDAFDTQDEGLFIHKGRVDNIRGVNVEFFKRDTVNMPGDYTTYRYTSDDKVYTDEFIEDITLETLRGEDEAIEYLVVVKYDNIPLIAVIVESK